jgi:phage terminase large subunit GpA-like protein
MGGGQVVAVKGAQGFSRPAPVVGPSYVDATEGGRKIRRGARLWTIAVATFKSETYRFLRLDTPTEDGAPIPAGAIHLPRGIDAEWIRQLVAEQLISVKTRRGFTRLEWQKLRERNEALDCRVYARAAAGSTTVGATGCSGDEEARTMSWTQAELEALKRAYASGTLRVSYEGKTVEYGSEADLIRRIRTIEGEMAVLSGNPRPRRSLASFRKG